MLIKTLFKIASLPFYIFSETVNQFATLDNWTTIDYFHRHSWKKDAQFTSENGGHKHKIDMTSGLALPAGYRDHTHALK